MPCIGVQSRQTLVCEPEGGQVSDSGKLKTSEKVKQHVEGDGDEDVIYI